MSEFDAIRPYYDHEVSDVLASLLHRGISPGR